MANLKRKFAHIVAHVSARLLMVSFFGLVLLIPLAAVGSVVWVVISATTPDLLSMRAAFGWGVVCGVVLLALGVAIASGLSGDAFPDIVRGWGFPCALLIIVAWCLQPVAARFTQKRLEYSQIVKAHSTARNSRSAARNYAADTN